MGAIDRSGNHHHGKGSPAGGQFRQKNNSAPSVGLSARPLADSAVLAESRSQIRRLRAADVPADGSAVTFRGANTDIRVERAKRFYLVGVCGDPHQNVTATTLREAREEAEALLAAPAKCEHCIPKHPSR